jgi:hypothetical protein
MSRLIDLTGKRFGRLSILSRAENTKTMKVRWKCLCDCGKEIDVQSCNLKSGNTKSCGCWNSEALSTRTTVHRLCDTPEYKSWGGMIYRCTTTTCKYYHNYGGRGITVCDRWLVFQNFYADMGPKPSRHHSIDRIDNSGNYCPANCKWSTRTEQSNNRRSNRRLTFNGETLTVAQWSRKLGISCDVLESRSRGGWPDEKALTTPVRRMTAR